MRNQHLPYTLLTKDNPVQLYLLNDGRYQIVKDGKFLSYIWVSPYYFLFRSRLAHLMLDLKVQKVRMVSAYIFKRGTKDFRNNYFQIEIGNQITNLHSTKLDNEGYKMWHYNYTHVLVSPLLKEQIEENGFHDLEFSYGFKRVYNIWQVID